MGFLSFASNGIYATITIISWIRNKELRDVTYLPSVPLIRSGIHERQRRRLQRRRTHTVASLSISSTIVTVCERVLAIVCLPREESMQTKWNIENALFNVTSSLLAHTLTNSFDNLSASDWVKGVNQPKFN